MFTVAHMWSCARNYVSALRTSRRRKGRMYRCSLRIIVGYAATASKGHDTDTPGVSARYCLPVHGAHNRTRVRSVLARPFLLRGGGWWSPMGHGVLCRLE